MKVQSAYFKKEFDLNKAELVGQGNFAQVYRIFDPDIEDSLAIRKVDKNQGESQDIEKERVINEELKKVKNQNILEIYDIIESTTAVWYVTEFCEGGSLWDALNEAKDNKMAEKDGLECVLQISKGVQELHNHRITHRDLKPENILLKTKYIPGKPLPTIKIADFGLSTKKIIMQTVAGTKEYIAPEQARFHNYTNAVDVWSLGIICDEILHGNPFYMGDNNKEVFQKIVKNPFKVRDQGLRSSIKEFLVSLLKKKPYQRPIIAVIRQSLQKILQEIEEEQERGCQDRKKEKVIDFKKKDEDRRKQEALKEQKKVIPERKVQIKEDFLRIPQEEQKKQKSPQYLSSQSSVSQSLQEGGLKKNRKFERKQTRKQVPQKQLPKTPFKRTPNAKLQIKTEQQVIEEPPSRPGRVPVRNQTHIKSGLKSVKNEDAQKKVTDDSEDMRNEKKQLISKTVPMPQNQPGHQKITVYKVDNNKKKPVPQYTSKKQSVGKAMVLVDTKDYIKQVAKKKEEVQKVTLQIKKNHEFIPNPQLSVNDMPEKIETEEIMKDFRKKYDYLNFFSCSEDYDIKLATGKLEMHDNRQKAKSELEKYRNSIKESFLTQIDRYVDHFVEKNIY